jgi:uncharacterized membrane protein
MSQRLDVEADMSKLVNFPGGILFGAGLMYLLDPVRGKRRRRRIEEAVRHAERVERRLLTKAASDAQNRVHGLVERVRHAPSAHAPDDVIEQRVRARIGHVSMHPGAIEISVIERRVILRGPVLADEADDIVRTARFTPGVREIVDKLERHDSPLGVPALQGGRRRNARGAWNPTLQAGAMGAGTLMMTYGIILRRGLIGTAIGAVGGALALRGALNRPFNEIVGKRGGITIQKAIVVNQPIHVVYDLWSRLDNFPLFMEHVREVDVQLGGNRSRWIVDGPAGAKTEFEAETTEMSPDRVIAWRTLEEQPIEHTGRITFEQIDEGSTRVFVTMTYKPPAGVVGHAVAHILGWDPKSRMDDDLIRMKALLEQGRTRAHHRNVELRDLH